MEIRNEAVRDDPSVKPVLSDTWNSYVRVPVPLDVTFCTVNVGRSVASCSPLIGETADGVESVNVPDPPPEPEGAVGPTGTDLEGLAPLPHADATMDRRMSAGNVRV